MSRGRFSGGLLGFIDGIKSGKDVVELCTEMSKTEAGTAGLNALAALLGIGTAASLAPAALPLTVGAVSVTAAVKFYLWWQSEQEKKTESAKLTDIQAILKTWLGSASGGWDRLEEKYGDLDASIKQNVVGFIESLLRYELGEVKESIDALTAQQDVRFQQMAVQLAEYQRQNHQVFASLSKSIDDSLGNSLVELIAGADSSISVKGEVAASLGPQLRTLLEMPVMVEAGLKRIEEALKPKVLLHNPWPSKTLTELNQLRFEQRLTKLVGAERPLQILRDFCKGERFAWLILTAPGGCGKSRLAQELCDELWLKGWNVGFYAGEENLKSWYHLKPDKPTLIVVDYLWAKLKDWPARIKALHEYQKQIPIRLLILERPADVSAWNSLINSCPECFHSYAGPSPGGFKIDALELPGLSSDEDIWSLMRQVWDYEEPVKYEQVFKGPGDGYRKLDPLGRPLIAMLVALGLKASGGNKFQWNLALITQALIRRILFHWKEAGVDDNHVRLLLLATLLDGLHLREQPELEGLPPKGEWDQMQCILISGYTDEFNPQIPHIPSLKPDPIGEAFAVYCLSGTDILCDAGSNLESRSRKAKRIAEWASSSDPLACQDFVRRAISDFRESAGVLLPCLTGNRELDLSGLGITSLLPLAPLAHLVKLNLDSNEISDLRPLGNLKELKFLSLSNNKICDLNGIETLTKLRALNLGGNKIKHLMPLQSLGVLNSLFLWDNRVEDVDALRFLNELEHLNISRNAVREISPLGNLRRLVLLSLIGNRFLSRDDISKLKLALPESYILF